MTQIKYYGVDTGIPISQKHFGQMDILLAVLAKYHQPLYKST